MAEEKSVKFYELSDIGDNAEPTCLEQKCEETKRRECKY